MDLLTLPPVPGRGGTGLPTDGRLSSQTALGCVCDVKLGIVCDYISIHGRSDMQSEELDQWPITALSRWHTRLTSAGLVQTIAVS